MRKVLPRVGTLADVVRSDRYIRLFCIACDRSVAPNMDELVTKHGFDLPVQRLLERARCSKCNARGAVPAGTIDLQVPVHDRPPGYWVDKARV